MVTRPVVLVVEDEPVCRSRMKALLERSGYGVRLAGTGAEALAAVECDPLPDAAILDLELPDQSGLDVCRALRMTRAARDFPILFLSAHADVQHRAEGLQAGGSDYLAKPVDGNELGMRLGTHLALVARTREVQAVERDWQQTFDALTDAVTLLDREGHILKCNQAMARLVGLPISGILGVRCHELMHHLEERIEGCPFLRMLESGTFQQTQLALEGRWFEITVEPLRDAEGEIRGGVHRIRDIHDRVMGEAARKALLASERRWRTMAEIRARLVEAERTMPLPDLLTLVLDEVSAQVESPIGFYHFYDEDTGNLTLQQWSTRTRQDYCRAEGQGHHYHVSRAGVWVDCLRQRRAVIHNDYAALPHRQGLPQGHAELIRELVVPVFRQERIVALLGVGNKLDPYTEQDLDAVHYLADLTWDLVERKALETRKAEEEAKFEVLFKRNPDGAFLLRREPVAFLDVNPRFASMLGFTPAEMVGRNALDLNLWVSLEDRAQMFRTLQEEGCVQMMECRLRTRDGGVLWVLLTLEAISLGGVACLIGTVRDISVRKRLELEREETQANLDALFRSTGDFVWSVDPEDRLLVFNQPLATYFETQLGMRPWMGALPEDGLPPDRAALWRRLYEKCRKEGPFHFEYPLADGRTFTYSVNPVTHPAGGLGVSVFGRDVTAWRKAERDLAEQRDAYEALFEHLENGFAVYEILRNEEGRAVDHRMIQANAGFDAHTGLDRREEIGRCSADLSLKIPPDILRQYYAVADSGVPIVLERYNPILQRHWEVRAYRPAPDRVATIFADISDRKRLEQELQQSRANLLGIMESTEDLVWSVDRDFRLLACNGGFSRQVHGFHGGVPRIGDPPEAHLPPEWALIWKPLYRQALSEGAFHTELALPGGQTFEFSLNPIQGRDQATGVAVFGKDITARLAAESELRAHHAVLQGILESSDSPVFSLDRAYCYTSFNRAHAEAMEGLYGSRIQLGDCLEQHQPIREDWLLAKANLDRALGGESFTAEATSGPGGPLQRFFQIRHQPIRNGEGAVTGVAVFATDHTKDYQKQRELNRLQEMLQQMQRIARVGAWEVDLNDGRLRWSEGVYRIYELTPEDYTPEVESSIQFYAPESQAIIRSAVQQAIETGNPFDLVVQLITASGRRIWVRAMGEVEHCEGRTVRVFGSFLDIDSERRTRLALQASETNLLEVGRLARVGGWRLDLRTQELTWNQVTREIHEVAADFIPTVDRAVGFYAPEAVPIIQAAVEACAREGRPFDVELPLRTATGKALWVRALGAAERDDQGLASIQGVFQDITDRHAAEMHQQASERRLRAIFETAADGLVLLDKESLAILDANPAFCRTYGYTVEELRRLTAVDMSAEPDRTSQATRGTATRVRGRLHRRKDGTVFPVDLTAGTFEEEGRVISVVSSRDISEQARVLEALRESEERLELVLEGAQLGFWDWDIQSGRVVRNARWAEMLGYSLEEVEQTIRQWTDLHHPDDREAAWRSIQDHLEGRTPEHRIQYRMQTKDGSYRWILDQARVMTRDGQGRPLRMCGTHTDVTALKAVELALQEHQEHLEELVEARTEQLESANQELEAFAYSVSHDLRAPLRSILGFSEALEEDFAATMSEEARGFLERIRKAGQRMGGLIEDLLRLSRVTRQDFVMSTVDVSGLGEEVCETLAQRHPEHPVSWHVERGLVCQGDYSLLHIALENLLSNAWKFTSRTASPQVWVESTATGDIRIRDNGAGFPAEKVTQLFTPFRRLHHETEFAGTGLGLAMVRRILARHGGTIVAEGSPGRGACFTLSFPR